jgi:eukaryotic-like serine/threonine-protein kinase
MSDMSNPERPVFNDRYEIHSRIGRGGMADVFLARDRLLDRPVAVKVLFPEYATDPSFVERFRREAQAAANLNHPNIVGVYDWGRQGGTYFIVMEYVNGRTLAELLRGDGPLPPNRAVDITGEVTAALSFAHRNGVVHRDVKPGNILVSPGGTVKVADFGIARALNSSTEADLTQAGAVMGTATYFSPEQAQGGNPDPRSDLYSLGIVMYEMAAGRPPFQGENPVAIAYKQVHEAPRVLSTARPDVPRGYEAIVMKLLAKAPADRYPSAEDLRADLVRFRSGQQPIALAALAASGTDPTTVGPRAAAVVPTTVVRASSPLPAVVHQPTTGMTRVQAEVVRNHPLGPPIDDGYFNEPPRRTGWLVAGLLLLAAVLALGTVLVVKQLSKKDTNTSVDVFPLVSLIGQPLDVAEKTLQNLNLVLIRKPLYSEGVPTNQVYDQDPRPDSLVKKGDQITLTYNPGKGTVALVSVVGLTKEEATKKLTELGLTPVFVDLESDTEPAGKVLVQDPPASEVAPGSKVTLTVSVGKGKAEVPNVLSLDQAAAAAQLGAKGFAVTTELRADEAVPAGKVVATDPMPGTTVDKGSSVKIIISDGPPKVAVPNVEGLSVDDAVAKLAGSFQSQIKFSDVPYGDARVNHVINQSVGPGAQVPKGTTITLLVGRELPAPTTVPTTSTTKAPTTTTSVPSTTSTTKP